ncbi:MAG: ABC transporter ATP-binding protein [Deltaproteobacteria bacterium HGW-Deltaproteobacteria-21]|nr:MAG: ABC transporter ATP-binding protein [Deltaproteobacteria bacterium HGW-Deltaproteobacteria-21]
MKLRIEKLSVTYRDGDHSLLALDQVSLELEAGRITALVGESGSGKTTLGKTIMGLLPENAKVEGNVRLDDEEIIGKDESDLNRIRWSRIAMVFQNGPANLNPVLRIVDQVAEPLVQRFGMKKSNAVAKAREVLQRMGLKPDLADRFPHELSGGEVQRGLLAMALILDPEVLILDEPTAALDAVTKAFVAKVILNMRAQKKAVLLITHDLDLARRLADDLLVLYLGQVMETMPASDLFSDPRHPYTLALGRSYPAMNATRDLGGIRGDGFYRVMHAHAQKERPAGEHFHISSPVSTHDMGHVVQTGCLFEPRCTQSIGECRKEAVPMFPAGDHLVRCVRRGIVTLLHLEGVSKRYDRTTALRPTSLDLRAGELFCLVGETGSGKTTLAMIAAGALNQDQGGRSIEGRDMDRWIREGYRSLARRIGVIYQNPADAVSHRLSVLDIVAEPLRIQGEVREPSEIRDRVRRILADVHLSTEPEFLRRYPHELNMGAIQRVCMARALILEPAFLVADEPTSSLDPSVQAKVLKMLLDVQVEKGLTMLFVTHDIGLARKIGDRIGVMLAGRLVEVGPAARVLGRAAHPYTRRLIECAQGEEERSAAEAGAPPDNAACPYAQRCERAEEQCMREPPPAVRLGGGAHLAWCQFPMRDNALA